MIACVVLETSEASQPVTCSEVSRILQYDFPLTIHVFLVHIAHQYRVIPFRIYLLFECYSLKLAY